MEVRLHLLRPYIIIIGNNRLNVFDNYIDEWCKKTYADDLKENDDIITVVVPL